METETGSVSNRTAGSAMEETVVLGGQLIPFVDSDGAVVLKGIIDQNGHLVLDTLLYSNNINEEQIHHITNVPGLLTQVRMV